MSKRLAEVATELGVSTKQITEFLQGKQIEILDKPSAKVPEEAYAMLQKNFKNSVAVKEKAEKLQVGNNTRKKEERPKHRPWEKPVYREPKTQIHQPSAKTTLEKEPLAPPVQNPNPESLSPEPKPQEKAEPEIIRATAAPLSGPKVLGKIDLDARSKRNLPPRQDNRPKNPPSKLEETPAQQEPNPKAPKPEVKTEQPLPTTQEPSPKAEPNNNPPAPHNEETNINSEANPNNEAVIERIEAPQLRGLKILGKINIDTNPKKKRKKKDRRDKFGKDGKVATATPAGTVKTDGHRENRDNQSNQPQRDNYNRDNQNRDNYNRDNQNRDQNNRDNQNRDNHQNYNRSGDNQGSNNHYNQARNRPTGLHSQNQRPPQQQNNDNQRPAANNQSNPAGNNNQNQNTADKKKGKPGPGINPRIPAVSRDEEEIKKGGTKIKNVKKSRAAQPTQKEIDDNVRQTMAKMQGGGKRKKAGTTRAERNERKEKRIREEEEAGHEIPTIQVTEFISVSELASLLEVSPTDIIMTCMNLGVFVSINQRLDAEIIEFVAGEFSHNVEFVSAEEQLDFEEEEQDDPEALQPRAPIVTVMGHVDHGKTSLLDYIRKANVVAGEAGGITQHIGAYEVKVDGRKITFLDTPGHEAFTAMRARGAKVTDIAVIIIAADDSVMPQTREAISHAQAAGVPIVFAINKVDKDGAQPEKIRQELATMNFLVEEWGGKYQSQEISAKKGLNVEQLLEKILLEAEMLELKADPTRRASGAVLEASLEKGRGYVAKVLIQTGTLRIGDMVVSGQHYGKVKAMFNERGKRVTEAGPATPVLVLGLDGAPQAGEKVRVFENERDAKDLASKRAQITRQQQIRATKRITLDEIGRRLALGNFKKLNLIVKGDMDGSVEALSDSLLKLGTESVQVEIVHKGVGQITESDVLLASASDAIVVGFQVRPNPMARRLAEQEGVEIKTYSVIYSAIDEIKSALEGMLEPEKVEKELGQVLVQQVFKISKIGTVAGCVVQEGKIHRNNHIRVVRNGIVVFPNKEGAHGRIGTLRRFKDSVTEVKTGLECGLTIDGFNDIQENDMIEVYEIIEVKQTL